MSWANALMKLTKISKSVANCFNPEEKTVEKNIWKTENPWVQLWYGRVL